MAGASAEGSFVGLSEDDVLMQSPPGQERVGVGMIDSDAMRGIFVADEKSKARAALAVSDEGSPSLDLSDEKGRPRAGLMLLPDGTPDLVLFDKDAKVLWEAP